MERQEEREIIDRVRGGERAAFAGLVDAYAKPIFNLAFRMTGSRQDADDLAQETFLRAFEQLSRFDPERSFYTWIYTIGLNLIRNHLKKHGREMTRENAAWNSSEAGIDHGAKAERDMMQAQEISRLEICLQKLPADRRPVLNAGFTPPAGKGKRPRVFTCIVNRLSGKEMDEEIIAGEA